MINKYLKAFAKKYPMAVIDDNDQLRQFGRTTRLVDQYMQELFTGEPVYVADHHQDGTAQTGRMMFDHISKIILRRLELEHYISFKSTPTIVKLDQQKHTIQLINLNNEQQKEEEQKRSQSSSVFHSDYLRRYK